MLDVTFYKNLYHDVSKFSDDEIREHYEKFGINEGRYCNLSEYLDRESGISNLSREFDPSIYAYLNSDVRECCSGEFDLVRHFIEFGLKEGRPYKLHENDFMIELYGYGANFSSLMESGEYIYTSINELLEKNGVSSNWVLEAFSSEDYIAFSGINYFNNRVQCLRHFLEVGLDICSPVNSDLYIQSDFYLSEHYVNLSGRDLALHYLNIGGPSGWSPNPSHFMKSLGLRDTTMFPATFDPETYLALNPDLINVLTSRWKCLEHLIRHGLPEGRSGCPMPAKSSDIYLAVADNLAIESRLAEANSFYQKILAYDDINISALQHYGDSLLKQGSFHDALDKYRKIIISGNGNIWTYFNCAHCQNSIGDYLGRLKTLLELSNLRAGDIALLKEVKAARRDAFNYFYQEAKTTAKFGLKDASSKHMENAIISLTTGRSFECKLDPDIKEVQKIAIVAEMSLPQCKLYRVQQKIDICNALGIECDIFDCWTDLNKFSASMLDYEIAIFYRVPAFPDIYEVIYDYRKSGRVSYYDIDDLIFDSNYYPEEKETYGGQISDDDYGGLIIGPYLYRTAMEACNYGISSTKALAGHMEKVLQGRKVITIPNGISSSHEEFLRTHCFSETEFNDNEINIFYGSGTKAHNSDFISIAGNSILKLMEKYPDIKLYIVGYLTLPESFSNYSSRIIEIDPVSDIFSYWSILCSMDINLSFLLQSEISNCKSEIKWLEAAMLGIPSLLPNTETYRDVVKDKIDALLYNNEIDFYENLLSLIESSDMRRRIGNNAKKAVLKKYSLLNLSHYFGKILTDYKKPKKDQALKIAIVNVFYPPQAIGGATRVVHDNATVISNSKHIDVRIFTTKEGGDPPYNVDTYFENGIFVTRVVAGNSGNVDRNPCDHQMGKVFGDFLDSFCPDVIHFHCIQRITAAACVEAAKRDIPYVITAHDGWWISPNQFLVNETLNELTYKNLGRERILHQFGPSELYRADYLIYCMSMAEKIIAVSDDFAALYKSCGIENVITIPNGVSPLRKANRNRRLEERVILAHIGGASPHKGFNLFKRAVIEANLSHIDVVIIDHALPFGSELVEMWGSTRVKFRSKIRQNDIVSFYEKIDVLVAPSMWRESYGLVTREALACGCWVLTSSNGAIGGDVSEENGFVIDTHSTEELIACLHEIDGNPQKFLEHSSLKSEIRSSDEQGRELTTLYRQIAKFHTENSEDKLTD